MHNGTMMVTYKQGDGLLWLYEDAKRESLSITIGSTGEMTDMPKGASARASYQLAIRSEKPRASKLRSSFANLPGSEKVFKGCVARMKNHIFIKSIAAINSETQFDQTDQ